MDIVKRYPAFFDPKEMDRNLVKKCKQGKCTNWKRTFFLQSNSGNIAVVSLNLFERISWSLRKLFFRSSYHKFKTVFETKSVTVMKPSDLEYTTKKVQKHARTSPAFKTKKRNSPPTDTPKPIQKEEDTPLAEKLSEVDEPTQTKEYPPTVDQLKTCQGDLAKILACKGGDKWEHSEESLRATRDALITLARSYLEKNDSKTALVILEKIASYENLVSAQTGVDQLKRGSILAFLEKENIPLALKEVEQAQIDSRLPTDDDELSQVKVDDGSDFETFIDSLKRKEVVPTKEYPPTVEQLNACGTDLAKILSCNGGDTWAHDEESLRATRNNLIQLARAYRKKNDFESALKILEKIANYENLVSAKGGNQFNRNFIVQQLQKKDVDSALKQIEQAQIDSLRPTSDDA